MRIATWNIERLKHKKELDKILFEVQRVKADILILTETDEQIHPDYTCYFHTPMLVAAEPAAYRHTENRVSIYTNYKFVCKHATFDKDKALCVELATEQGNLIVYGTIIGIYGNRHPGFKRDLRMQVEDWKHLSANGTNICVCGDFNCSFGDNYYYTKFARETITNAFSESHIELLTKNQSECIDHIAVSKSFVAGCEVRVKEWNFDKRLSDHKGIVVEIESQRSVIT